MVSVVGLLHAAHCGYGKLGDELAIECIKAGVNDYVLKENLGPVAVRRALEEEKSAREA